MNTITKEIILERLNRFKNRVTELGGTTSKIVCKEAKLCNGKFIPGVFRRIHPNRVCRW